MSYRDEESGKRCLYQENKCMEETWINGVYCHTGRPDSVSGNIYGQGGGECVTGNIYPVNGMGIVLSME